MTASNVKIPDDPPHPYEVLDLVFEKLKKRWSSLDGLSPWDDLRLYEHDVWVVGSTVWAPATRTARPTTDLDLVFSSNDELLEVMRRAMKWHENSDGPQWKFSGDSYSISPKTAFGGHRISRQNVDQNDWRIADPTTLIDAWTVPLGFTAEEHIASFIGPWARCGVKLGANKREMHVFRMFKTSEPPRERDDIVGGGYG